MSTIVPEGEPADSSSSQDAADPEAPQRPPLFGLPRLMAAFVAAALGIGVLGGGVAMPATYLAGRGVTAGVDYFNDLPAELGNLTPPQTSQIVDADGEVLANFYLENRTLVPLNRISKNLRDAVISIEDHRFYEHGAIDPQGILRALSVNVTGDEVQGASTLTQQFVKNVVLTQAVVAGDERGQKLAVEVTNARKVREMRLAMAVEEQMSKDDILAGYLNLANFGASAFGAEAAAQRYFGVSAANLDLPQAALLAGLVQNPTRHSPIRRPEAAKERRDVVLGQMLNYKKITKAQHDAAVRTPVRVTGNVLSNGCTASPDDGFFCQYVYQSIVKDDTYKALGDSPEARRRALLTGGWRVTTTLQRDAQEASVRAVNRRIPADDRSGLGTSSVTVEPGTGAVVAMAQNRQFATQEAVGSTAINYGVDANLGGSQGFQVGSSFKAFTLAAWLKAGRGLDETVNGTQRTFRMREFRACGERLGGGPYKPGNAEGSFSGSLSVADATRRSVNVAYVEMESQLDLCDIAKTAEDLGVHLAAPAQICDANAEKNTQLPTCLPSLTLGVTNIAPLTMAAAYAGFATDGMYCKPMPVTALRNTAGKEHTFEPQCTRALDERVARGVNRGLSHALTSGTASSVGTLRWPASGKTGTTNGPYDTWFVGYTRQRSTAVWVGDPGKVVDGRYERRRLRNIRVNGSYYGTIYGATIAGRVWKDSMRGAMSGLPVEPIT